MWLELSWRLFRQGEGGGRLATATTLAQLILLRCVYPDVKNLPKPLDSDLGHQSSCAVQGKVSVIWRPASSVDSSRCVSPNGLRTKVGEEKLPLQLSQSPRQASLHFPLLVSAVRVGTFGSKLGRCDLGVSSPELVSLLLITHRCIALQGETPLQLGGRVRYEVHAWRVW